MRIGIFASSGTRCVSETVGDIGAASAVGLTTYWLPYRARPIGHDALTLLALAGSVSPAMELGVAVAPVYSRPPSVLASQALTVQAASGRLTLGLGVSNARVVADLYGGPFTRPTVYMAEYVAVLRRLLTEDVAIDFDGDALRFRGSIQVDDRAPCPQLLVAAVGPRMTRVAGAVGDGVITWMCGPRMLRDHCVPVVQQAAHEAGRASPRVVACLPVCVTDEIAAARARAAEKFAVYEHLPWYRAAIAHDGGVAPADAAVIGDEEVLFDVAGRLAEAGVTDLAAAPLDAGGEERERTVRALAALTRATSADTADHPGTHDPPHRS